MVARANPDGYTLLLTSTAIAVNPGLFENLPYDPIKDFVPISELVNAPNVLFVRPDSGITSIADLVAKAKAEPDQVQLRFARRRHQVAPDRRTARSCAPASTSSTFPIAAAARRHRRWWPARSSSASVALAPVEPLIKSGTVKALAVTGATRWWSLPDVPTMIESGYPGFVSDTFNALFAPAGTPPEVVALLVRETRAAMAKPEASGGGAPRGLPNCRRHPGRDDRAPGHRNRRRERARREGRHQARVDLRANPRRCLHSRGLPEWHCPGATRTCG